MGKNVLLSATALRSAVFFGALAGFALPAAAQDQGSQAADPAGQEAQQAACDANNPNYNPQTGLCPSPTGADGSAPEAPATPANVTAGNQEVVVTGSRIRRPNLESNVPITSIAGESFFQQGQTNIGETLNDLPQLRSTFAQTNPGLGIGIAGLNLLDLRGLGTLRTLVLVNGRRHVPADILVNAASPDVNTIPNDLVERVDVVTGGNSAIYGSDAIAGVVNFVLRRNFDGLQLRAQYGQTEVGFGKNGYASAMYGKNFADGAANITLHGEYAKSERVFAKDIPWLRSNDNFGTVDVDTAGLINASDGFPDAAFIRDIRSTTINRFGLIPISNPIGGSAPCGVGLVATNGPPGNIGGTPYNCAFIFTPDGRLTPLTGTRFSTGPLGGIFGGNGQTGREDELLSVLPRLERYNFNLLAHATISDAFEPFVEAKWNRVKARGSNAGPSFSQGQLTQFDIRERVRLDNPFLNPADRTTLANAILASGCNTVFNAVCNPTLATGSNVLTPAQIAAINDGSYRFILARQFADSGIRDEEFQRDTYRVVGGLRGSFNEDWNYEVSLNYGKFKEDTTTFGYFDRQRFVLSYDAGRDPADGRIKCRAQFDAASAVILQRADLTPAQVTALTNKLAADIAACVPYNPFGGLDNTAAANYFVYNAEHRASLSQFVASGFMSGDTSQVFELPGGPVRFAIGAEYRREKALYRQDPFVEQGFTNAVVIPTFDPPAFKVKEAFGEVQIPLLKDMPYFEELTLSGAARVAKYQGGTGTVWAYNTGVDWSPMGGLRLRGNYGRAVRAPNVSETGFPLVPNFATISDPCSPQNIAVGNRATACAAAFSALGIPNTVQNRTYSLGVLSGSNPNLQAETSDSITLGFVAQPRFLRGLSVSSDFYNIKVSGIITAIGAQTIINNCYDLPAGNPFCNLFQRNRGPGPGPAGEAVGEILFNTLIQAPLNFAKRVRKGIDTQINYRTNVFDGLRLDANLIWTHNLQISNFESTIDPTFENRILGELGDPKDEFRLDTDWTFGDFTFGYRLRYIGSQYTSTYEAFNELQGRPPTNADAIEVRKYPVVTYSDIRVDWTPKGLLGRDFRFYAGVDNVFDKIAPFGLTSTGAGSAIYDFRGRRYYVGSRVRF